LENYIGNDANHYATVANETLNHNPLQGADVRDGDFRGVGGAGGQKSGRFWDTVQSLLREVSAASPAAAGARPHPQTAPGWAVLIA